MRASGKGFRSVGPDRVLGGVRPARHEASMRALFPVIRLDTAFGFFPTYVGLYRDAVVLPRPTYLPTPMTGPYRSLKTYLPTSRRGKLAHAALCAHERPGTCSSHRPGLADAAPRREVADPNGLDRSISACYGVARIQEPY